MYSEAQERVISLVNVIRRRYKPPNVRTWIFRYNWRGKPHVLAMVAVRLTGNGALGRRKRIEARLKVLKDVNVTTFLDGEYIKYIIEV